MTSTIFQREFLRIVTSKGFLLATFGMPVFAGIYFLFIGGATWLATNQFSDTARNVIESQAEEKSLVGILDQSTLLTNDTGPLHRLPSGKRYLYRQKRAVRIHSLEKLLAEDKNSEKENEGEKEEEKESRIVPFLVFSDLESAKSALEQGKIAALIHVTLDYVDTGDVDLVLSEPADDTLDFGQYQHKLAVENMLHNAFLHSLGLPLEARERIEDKARFVNKILEKDGAIVPQSRDDSVRERMLEKFARKGMPYVFVMFMFVGIISNSNRLVRSMNEERENKLTEVLLTTVSAKQLLSGKVMGILCASLLQFAVWAAMVLALPGLFLRFTNVSVNFNVDNIPLILCIFFAVLGMLFYGFFYAGLGAFKKDPNEISGLRAIFIIGQLFLSYGLIIFLPGASDLSWSLFSTIPFLTPFLMPFQLMEPSYPLQVGILHLLLMLLFTVLMVRLSASLFRVRLMYKGQAAGVVFLICKVLQFSED